MPPPDNDYSCPGPRKEPAAWVGKDKDRIYVLFGQCERNGAYLNGELHGASDAYAFEDMWSWNIKEERWVRERLAGNPPCPRGEMACTYLNVPSHLLNPRSAFDPLDRTQNSTKLSSSAGTTPVSRRYSSPKGSKPTTHTLPTPSLSPCRTPPS